MTHHEDIPQIITAIQSGNKDIFSIIVNRYKNNIFRIALGYMHSKDDAEDIVQEVFIKVYQSIGNFKGKSEFYTWLYRITVNQCLNTIAKRDRASFFTRTEDSILKILNVRSQEKNPEEVLVKSEQDKLIRTAIESLPKQQKTAFILSRYEDLTQKEISNIMGISEGAVEQLLQRSRSNLNAKLKYLK